MQWFHALGCRVTGVDRSDAALVTAGRYGSVLQADLEAGPWPMSTAPGLPQHFDVVLVTNYLWRPLFPTLLQSLSPGGLLLYETFAMGQETLGKPSRPEFLLQPGELLQCCQGLRVLAFEDGFLDEPARFVQRIAAVKPIAAAAPGAAPQRYPLSLK